MKIHAYQEFYLNKAQQVLGDAFDCAINFCGLKGKEFVDLFLVSSISKRIENGEPSFLVGKSGIDIVLEVLEETEFKKIKLKSIETNSRSKEYWIGWALSYYQWYSDRSFQEIFKAISYDELENSYYTLHEADISKFIEIMDDRIKETFSETNLKYHRNLNKLSQQELSKRSGVNIRSIQMYEQKNKDINKASVETLYRLSKILSCSIEDLIEK